MTATEVLRRMLDEHDEYYKTSGNKTWWGRPIDRQTGKPINVFHYQAQPMGEDRLLVELQLATPAQAIAATLGETPTPPPPTMPEQPPYDLLIDLLRDEWDIDVSWDGLRRFWYVGLTDEGVRKRDEREATLGATDARPTQAESSGTCKRVFYEPTGVYVCSECGRGLSKKLDKYCYLRFCPNCGRRIVDPTTNVIDTEVDA